MGSLSVNIGGMESKYDFAKDTQMFDDVDPKWCGKEELLLLDAIEFCGYGNWKQIAEYLVIESGKEFSPIEVQEHYETNYYDGEIGDKTFRKPDLKPDEFEVINHATGRDAYELILPDFTKFPLLPRKWKSKLEFAALDRDIDKEFDPEAEQLIEEVDFNEYDDEQDTEMMLGLVNIYRRRLKTRVNRKNLVQCEKMVEACQEVCEDMLFSIQAQGPKNLQFREEIFEFKNMIPLAPLLTQKEFKEYFESRVKIKRIKPYLIKLVDKLGFTFKKTKARQCSKGGNIDLSPKLV